MSLWIFVLVLSVAAYEYLARVPAGSVRGGIRLLCGDVDIKHFDLMSTVHSIVMGSLAVGCYLWEMGYADVRYPASVYACLGPSSSLAAILPAIEAGYAISELAGVLFRKWDRLLVLHGVVVLVTVMCLRALGVDHFAYQLFSIHISTIFLNLRGVDFGGSNNIVIDVAFLLTFAVLRIVVLPAWWVQFLVHGHRLGPEA